MTLSTQASKAAYTGNGATTVFPVPFPFLREADIKVLLRQEGVETPLLPGTHYTLAGAGSPSGGSLCLHTPPATGHILVLYREPAIVQEVDYVENSAFPAETHEAALDLLTMICQALDEKLSRAVLYPVSTPQNEVLGTEGFLDACTGAREQARAAAAEAETQAGLAQDAFVQAHIEAVQAQVSANLAQAAVGGLRVSASDAIAGSLSAKLAAGDGLAETLLNPGADEALRLSVALAADPGLEFLSGLLRVKIATGMGLARTASGLGADIGTGSSQLPTNEILRPAMVAGRVLNHRLSGGA